MSMEATVQRESRPEIEIRDMEIDDLAPVFHLGEKTFTSEVPNLYRSWDEYEVTNLFNSEPALCLVAEDKNRELLAGFAVGTTVSKRRSSWTYGYMLWMAVAADYRQMGVGERLVRHLAERMVDQGARILMVDTDADNRQALGFFGSLGFDQPRPHVYLSLNLDRLRKRRLGRRKS
jgi:ribosomal protein S18 acetylase RimI-like enzyme